MGVTHLFPPFHITHFYYTLTPLAVSPSILLLIAAIPCKSSPPPNVLYIIPSTDRLIPLATHATYLTLYITIPAKHYSTRKQKLCISVEGLPNIWHITIHQTGLF